MVEKIFTYLMRGKMRGIYSDTLLRKNELFLWMKDRILNVYQMVTCVHLGHKTSIPQNKGPCNSDYKDLCNDFCLCVLDQLINQLEWGVLAIT